MKVLVTGGAGFIGSHVVARYHGRAEVVVLDSLRTGRRAHLDGLRCTFVEGSILDAALVRRCAEGVDLVFHLAALISVPESVRLPLETVEINVRGLVNVLEACAAAGVRKLCFASSSAVYGENPEPVKREDAAPDPRSPYAITKLSGEHWCAHYARERGLPTACLRFFNVFGPRQDPSSPYAAAVPAFVRNALAGEDLLVHGDGLQTRDFIHVDDIASALAFAAEGGVPGVLNAGYGTGIAIRDLAALVLELTGSRSRVRHGPPRAGDIRHAVADTARLLAAGWRPRHDLRSGLAAFVARARSG